MNEQCPLFQPRTRCMTRWCWSLAALLLVLSASARGEEDGATLFETKIRPVLAGTCFKCHGGGHKAPHTRRLSCPGAPPRGKNRGPLARRPPGDSPLSGALPLDAHAHSPTS